jgi:hypothetical protein
VVLWGVRVSADTFTSAWSTYEVHKGGHPEVSSPRLLNCVLPASEFRGWIPAEGLGVQYFHLPLTPSTPIQCQCTQRATLRLPAQGVSLIVHRVKSPSSARSRPVRVHHDVCILAIHNSKYQNMIMLVGPCKPALLKRCPFSTPSLGSVLFKL